MEALRCCSQRAHPLWSKHTVVPFLMRPQYTGHICVCLYVHACMSVCIHMDNVLCVFLYLHEYSLGTVKCEHVSVYIQICQCLCPYKWLYNQHNILNRGCLSWTISKRCHPSKEGRLTYVSTHAANDLITTLVICGALAVWCYRAFFSCCSRWLGKHN